MKCMTVGVGKARHDQPSHPNCVTRRTDTNSRNAAVLHLDDHIVGEPCITQPRSLAMKPGHEPTRFTNAVIRSTNAARWNCSNCSQVVNDRVSTKRSTNNNPSR